MAEAPTNEIAIGRKMKLLETFSPVADSLSARTATMTPNTTVSAGTINNHRRLLVIACQNASDLKMNLKLSRPTYAELSAFANA